MNKIKTTLAILSLLGTGSIAQALEAPFTCSHGDSFRTIYVTVESTSEGIFKATILEKDKFTYSIPGEPLPVIAEYHDVVHNQHMDLYLTHDGQFSLLLGDASPQPHLHAGNLDMDLTSCNAGSDTTMAHISFPTKKASSISTFVLSSFRSCSPAEEQRGCHTEGGYNGLPYCDCSGSGNATAAFLGTQSETTADQRQVEGVGEIGGPDEPLFGAFGTCSSPDHIGYVYFAKNAAAVDADKKCTPLKATKISEFVISEGCKENLKTAIATALFECRD